VAPSATANRSRSPVRLFECRGKKASSYSSSLEPSLGDQNALTYASTAVLALDPRSCRGKEAELSSIHEVIFRTHRKALGRVPISSALMTSTMPALKTNPRAPSVTLRPSPFATLAICGGRLLDIRKSCCAY